MDGILTMFVIASAVGLGAILALEIVIYKSMDRMREEMRLRLHGAAEPQKLTGTATVVPEEGRAHGFSLPERPSVMEQVEIAEKKKTVSLGKPKTQATARKEKEIKSGPALASVDVSDVSAKIKRDETTL